MLFKTRNLLSEKKRLVSGNIFVNFLLTKVTSLNQQHDIEMSTEGR